MSCSTFSQTLKPNLVQIEADTNFCFTIPQSKVIATYLIKGQFADSLEVSFDKEVSLFRKKLETEEAIKRGLNQKIINLDEIVAFKEESIGLLQLEIKEKEKKIKRAKWQKIALGVLSTAASVAVIIK